MTVYNPSGNSGQEGSKSTVVMSGLRCECAVAYDKRRAVENWQERQLPGKKFADVDVELGRSDSACGYSLKYTELTLDFEGSIFRMSSGEEGCEVARR